MTKKKKKSHFLATSCKMQNTERTKVVARYILEKVHMPPSNYYSIVNVTHKLPIVSMSFLNYKKMLNSQGQQKDKHDPKKKKYPHKFEKKN